ncbi:MAG: ATP-binding cassette domain-containing protein [Caldilineaceae bacterium]|nr:ATP-binding cassette domain-containing protein [Caldilineaceae bacterium]
MNSNTSPLLTMMGVRKTFGPVMALDIVDLTLQRGEILGLLGGNGAGKTTLMNVLFGLYKADAGQIELNGKPLDIHSPRAALEHGIAMVHQHFLQVNDFSVVENVVLGTRLPNRPTMQLDDAAARIRALSSRFGLDVDPMTRLGDLSMGVRQRVEILKGLYRGVNVLILDEPTTMLTPQEVDDPFSSLREMVDSGMSVMLAILPLAGGRITIDGLDVAAANTRQLLAANIAYVPEDRWDDGFLPKATVAENLILGQQRTAQYSNGRFLNWPAIFQRSRQLIDQFNIKTEGPEATAGHLSGGNIQRLMLARAFASSVRVLVTHNPTQGLDIPSIEFIYKCILERKADGMATLLISEKTCVAINIGRAFWGARSWGWQASICPWSTQAHLRPASSRAGDGWPLRWPSSAAGARISFCMERSSLRGWTCCRCGPKLRAA